MNSIKCFSCGFVSWADQEICKRCGASLTASPDNSYPEQPPQPNYQRPAENLWQQRTRRRLAIAAAIIGAVNLPTLGLLGVGAIVGVIVSLVALKRIRQRPDLYSGQGLATAGLVMSLVSVVIAVPIGIIAAIAIPNLLAARQAANEGSAIYSLRRIGGAEATYQSKWQKYGTLEELSAEHLIDPNLAAGMRSGYKFRVIVSSYDPSSAPEFDATASPTDYSSSGRRSFLIDETGVIRGADSRGGDASRSDPPLEERRANRSDDD
jgi:type II secretory pathway pseudopilin PulG